MFFVGNLNEREAILSATVFKLSEEGYTEDDINNIEVRYRPLKVGRLPYEVYVIFQKATSVVQIYSWGTIKKDRNKEYRI